MIYIDKRDEPYRWKQYRNTPGAKYQSQDYLVDALLEEQGYICAYCMRRVPCRDRINGNITQEGHRIEHVLSRNEHPELQLSYRNMVVCCPGHLGEHDHCDRLKGDRQITFSPLDKHFTDTLYYKDGSIKSTNEQWTREMEEVLNLNDKALVRARKTMLAETMKLIVQTAGKKEWTRQMVEKYIEKYKTMHLEKGKMKHYPYCGIVVYHLHRKLKNMK